MQNGRNPVTPPQQINRVPARDFVNIRHYQQVIILNTCLFKQIIQSNPLISFLDKRVYSLFESARDLSIGQTGLDEIKLGPGCGEYRGLREARESRIGLEENKFGYIRVKLFPAYFEDIELVAE
ncbi:hypothetical protein STAS_33716 [Striga asiatica]|uniref:Uncharacterized protein n=1 Tax=Striga asiatica TaxID=4170 RepID=A0A5A7RFP8_STRAF|nr:hypothetical protein STAS_33716 [Striga asiatica]